MTLRQRRHTVLSQIKKMDPEHALDTAAKHLALLQTGAWPQWLDYDAVLEQQDLREEGLLLASERRKDLAYLKANDLTDTFYRWWASMKTVISYRTGLTSSDRNTYWRHVCTYLLNAHLCLENETLTPTHFPLVPQTDQPLADLLDIWVDLDAIDTLRNHLLMLETGMMQTIFMDELARNTHGLPVDETTLGCAWRQAILDGTVVRGEWMGDHLLSPVSKIMKIYGDGIQSAGLLLMMETADKLELDINLISGPAWLQVMEDDRIHRFYRLEDGKYDGDTSGWMHLTMRAALILGMSTDGSLLVERKRAFTTQNMPVRDVYAAALCDETWGWLDKAAVRAVHEYSFETGQPMERDPGKLYRGFYEDFPQALPEE